MDIVREDFAEKKKKRRIVIAAASAAAILLITLGLSRLKPAAPSVDKSAVWMDTVKRGPMLRQVRGPGTLVPEEIRFISAATDGRVERLVILPGAPVKPDSVLIEMSNPVLEREALDAESQLRASQAELLNVKAQADRQVMDQQAAAATVRSDFHQAELQAATNEGLYKEGLIAELTVKLSRVRAEELETRNAIEEKRVASVADAAQAQVAVQEAHVEALKALAALKRSQKDALHVRAGISGVLQELPVQVGQQVAPGTTLAKVAEPTKLKAQLKIAETQAKDVQIGQPASIDTRNGVVAGKVARIDPAVQNGTVTVDVRDRGGAAPGRAAGPVGGRHDRARPPEGRPLRRPPGVRPGEEPGRALPGQRGRRRGRAREGAPGQELGEHGRDPRGPEARRQGDSLRHERVGRVRQSAVEVRSEEWA